MNRIESPVASVLVVDDDPQVRTLIRTALEKSGYQARDARSVTQALAQCRERAVDLVIMDILMPDVDGIEGIREFRRRFPRTRILAMSGGSERTGLMTLDAAQLLGAAGVLKKPFTTAEMLSAVGRYLHTEAETGPSDPRGAKGSTGVVA